MNPAITHGCADADCGYKTAPSTMGTPYKRCPLCGGDWIDHPPAQRERTGLIIEHYTRDRVTGQERKTRTTVVRPHLQGSWDALEARKAAP
jgi:hypothetical protein